MNWHHGLPPVTGEVVCSGAIHKITWEAGRLTLQDHDVESERAFVALGGEPCYCLDVLDSWETLRSSLSPLFLYSHGTGGAVMTRAQYQSQLASTRQAFSKVPAQFPAAPHLAKLETELKERYRSSLLSDLPDELKDAFTLEFFARAEILIRDDPAFATEHKLGLENVLANAANPALEQSMRSWTRVGDYPLLAVETWMVQADEEPTVVGWMSADRGFAAASLPVRWFTQVHAHRAAVVDGCFILSREEFAGDATWMTVTAARWERQPPAVSEPGGEVDAIDKHYRDRWTPVIGEALLTRSRSGGWILTWA